MTHACVKCGTKVSGEDLPDRVETVTVCKKGGTCVYARRPDDRPTGR